MFSAKLNRTFLRRPNNGQIKFNYVGSPCTVVNTGHGTMQARSRA